MKLPEGKENVIAGDPNPTRSVMNIWINRDGRHATLKKLLEALTECQQGGLVHRIEQMLDVELKSDIVDGVQNMHVTEPKKSKHSLYVFNYHRELFFILSIYPFWLHTGNKIHTIFQCP